MSFNVNAHIIASGNIETKRFFIGDGSGITNIQSGALPSDVVYDADLVGASGDLQTQIDNITTGSDTSVSGIDGGPALSGLIVLSGIGAEIRSASGMLIIEPDVRRAELVFASVNQVNLTHSFGERPVVQIYDGAEQIVMACVTHNSTDEVQVDFLEPQSGRVIVVG